MIIFFAMAYFLWLFCHGVFALPDALMFCLDCFGLDVVIGLGLDCFMKLYNLLAESMHLMTSSFVIHSIYIVSKYHDHSAVQSWSQV